MFNIHPWIRDPIEPRKKNETASHQWFKENKKDGYFMKVLPKADEDARKNLESEKALYTYTRNKN